MHIMNNPVDIITFEEFPEGLLCSENSVTTPLFGLTPGFVAFLHFGYPQ